LSASARLVAASGCSKRRAPAACPVCSRFISLRIQPLLVPAAGIW
jgi:hypothetical protein